MAARCNLLARLFPIGADARFAADRFDRWQRLSDADRRWRKPVAYELAL